CQASQRPAIDSQCPPAGPRAEPSGRTGAERHSPSRVTHFTLCRWSTSHASSCLLRIITSCLQEERQEKDPRKSMRIQLLVDRSTVGGNTRLAAALSFCAVVLGVMAFAPPVHAAPTYLSQSECRNGFWHVITYDISDPNHWVQLPPPDG